MRRRGRGKSDERPFLTGDPKVDFARPRPWLQWPFRGKTTPANERYFKKLAGGWKHEHPACDYWDQVEYEKQFPGKHHSDDLEHFYEWLKRKKAK